MKKRLLLPVLLLLTPAVTGGELTLIEARPSEETLRTLEALGALDAFPKAHIYNAEGFLLGTITGYPRPDEDPHFYDELQRLLELKQHGREQLADAARTWQSLADSGRIAKLPAADYYVVERYADWCNPCRRFMQDFPAWVEKQKENVVLIKLDLMPDDSPAEQK